MAKKYRGEGIVAAFDLKRCIHAAECVKRLPVVFNPQKRPWIQIEHAENDTLAEVVSRCPSGALQFERSDGGANETARPINTITAVANGPLYLRGDMTVSLSNGSQQRETRLALCRCGQSANKPFCDNSHIEDGFKASASVVEAQADLIPVATGGELQLTPLPDGPILIQGDFVIVDGGGETVSAGDKGALCRCGRSANKPFCDGTHKEIGFSAD